MGLAEFQTVIVANANPAINVAAILINNTDPIAVNGSVRVDVFAPAGHIGRVNNMLISWDNAVGTTGSKEISVNGAAGNFGMFSAVHPYNAAVLFSAGEWTPAPTSQKPAGGGMPLVAMMKGVCYDDQNALQVFFNNKTDAADGGTMKTVRVWAEEEKVTG